MSRMERQSNPNRVRRAMVAAGAALAIIGATNACNDNEKAAPTSQNDTEATSPSLAPTTTLEQGPHNERVRTQVLEPLLVTARSFYETNKAAATVQHSADDRTYVNFVRQTKDGLSVEVHIDSEPGVGNPLYANSDQISRLEMTAVKRGQGEVTSDNPRGDLVLQEIRVFTAPMGKVERLDVTGSQYESDSGEVIFGSQGDISGIKNENWIISQPDEAISIAAQVAQQMPPSL